MNGFDKGRSTGQTARHARYPTASSLRRPITAAHLYAWIDGIRGVINPGQRTAAPMRHRQNELPQPITLSHCCVSISLRCRSRTLRAMRSGRAFTSPPLRRRSFRAARRAARMLHRLCSIIERCVAASIFYKQQGALPGCCVILAAPIDCQSCTMELVMPVCCSCFPTL